MFDIWIKNSLSRADLPGALTALKQELKRNLKGVCSLEVAD